MSTSSITRAPEDEGAIAPHEPYRPSMAVQRRISAAYGRHASTHAQRPRLAEIRGKACSLATYLIHNCPDCPELAIALRKLEEVALWGREAILRNE